MEGRLWDSKPFIYLAVLFQSTYSGAWNIVGAQKIFVTHMYEHAMEGSIFSLVHGF